MSDAIILPPKYYLAYFDYLTEFVRSMYGHLLHDEELRFLEAYQNLPEDPRCLFIRMSNRKGLYFKTNSLSYPEIADTAGAMKHLAEAGFAKGLCDDPPDDIASLLDMLTKPDLWEVTSALKPVIMPAKSIKKPDLTRWLLHEYDAGTLIGAILKSTDIVRVGHAHTVGLMKFLFFGNNHDDMTEFVIRDLGHVRFQSFDEEALSRKFESRKEIDDSLLVTYLKEVFSDMVHTHSPEEVYEWFSLNHSEIADNLSAGAVPSLDRLVLKVAGWAERCKLYAPALDLYNLISVPPARERKARLLYKLGYREEAGNLCLEMIGSPQNADELYFGKDFYEKISRSKKRVIRQTTLALHNADVITLSVRYRHQVEAGAAHHFIQEGYGAFFSENVPWRSIFGLLFWDIIYDTNVQAIHHPLQRVPSDFFLPDFYQKREHMLRERIGCFSSPEEVRQALASTFEEKFGITNVLVGWHDELLGQVLTITRLLSVEQLRLVLMEMATDLRDKTRGFPDLLVWKDDYYSFVEIKSPTDHLSARQLYWQHFFREIGVSSRIVRVRWEI